MIKKEEKKLLKRHEFLEAELVRLDLQLVGMECSTSEQNIKYKKVDYKNEISGIESQLVALHKDEENQSPSVRAETADSEQAPFSRLVAC